MGDLLQQLAEAGPDHEALVMQVVIGLGLDVEAMLQDVLCGEGHCRAELKTTDPVARSRYQEDPLLARHYIATKQVLADEGHFSFCSWVGGRNLSAGYFLLPGGVVIEAFTQVRFCLSRSGQVAENSLCVRFVCK